MGDMFYNCNSLISLDLKNFDTSSVTDIYHMLYNYSSLISISLSKFNTLSTVDMFNMFIILAH